MARVNSAPRRTLPAIALTWLLLLGATLLAGCSLGPIELGGSSTASATPGSTFSSSSPAVPTVQPTASPVPRSFSGKVVDLVSGKPVSGAEVTAGGVMTQTGAGGLFAFDSVPLNAKIAVRAEGFDEATVELGSAADVLVKLRPNVVGGVVTDASTGKPLANVLVRMSVAPPAVSPTGTLTTGATVTATTVATATAPVSGTSFFMKGLSAPAAQSGATSVATITEVPVTFAPTTPTDVPPTATPVPPTATPTPKPIPPTGPDFVAVYTDEAGAYRFANVPQNAVLTFKLPGYKLTKLDLATANKTDVALEVFKPEAIYITAPVMATKELFDGLLDFMSNSRINAAVINVQNDNSEWVFDVKNPDAVAADNTDVFLPDMADRVKLLKERGIYTIARIVTFQEPTMAKARLDWAVKSSVTGKAWLGGQLSQQAWLDASIPAVQDHLVAMTREVLALGFDEVQYDYVRFPSDPAPTEPGKPVFSEPMTDTLKAAAVQSFLKKAYNTVQPTDAFMSIDIFGYTLWPDRDGRPLNGVIGQVFESLVDYTDYVCPMIYPSHFSPGEQGCPRPENCAYELVKKSGEFADKRFAGKRAKYRPWLQDFDWLKTDYTSPGTTKVADQIRAAKETKAWGWQWWDPFNDYEPREAFRK